MRVERDKQERISREKVNKLAHRPGKVCLDNAFTLIEGHPS